MYQRAKLKQEVKQTIAGVRPRPMWIALIYLVILSVGSSLLNNLITAASGLSNLLNQFSSLSLYGAEIEDILSEIVLLYANQIGTLISTLVFASLLGSILSALWQSLMGVGFEGYCLSIVKGENPTAGRIFCGFPMFGKVILTSLLVWVFTALWSLLWTVCLVAVVVVAALLMEAVPAVGVLLMVIGYIGWIALILRTTLRYAMTDYILLDTGKYGLEAINESKQMMKGNKWKLFVLQLSFIGWYLLLYAIILVGCIIIGVIVGVGAAGIAGSASMAGLAGMIGGVMFVLVVMIAAVYLFEIWLMPYVTGATAKFYLHFKPQEPVNALEWPTWGDSTTTSEDSEY